MARAQAKELIVKHGQGMQNTVLANDLLERALQASPTQSMDLANTTVVKYIGHHQFRGALLPHSSFQLRKVPIFAQRFTRISSCRRGNSGGADLGDWENEDWDLRDRRKGGREGRKGRKDEVTTRAVTKGWRKQVRKGGSGRMKILGGSLKGRFFLTNKGDGYRPVTSLIKESLFGILTSGQFADDDMGQSVLHNATIIDVFGGTGAFTFEAISRGASRSIVVEIDSQNVQQLRQNAEMLGVADQVSIIRSNALNLPDAIANCTVAFLDPPFEKNLVEGTVKSLVRKKWLPIGAIMVVRTHTNEKYDISDFCHEVMTRNYGDSVLCIYECSSTYHDM
eukprot:gnl/MRDRNA2_/MRDRNA2_65531_c0_seq1.p1 gnl/MRDRNA2_/MRDRNA2_65531_c0~~gnl/MRDRNA2_/MRDRNA2_65531_c0_seq1.p1  ORF type:complete len:337 (+),score=43.96 gnl/MRDRNA2_/MRDRNA2_65531_c0_seq1:99-1109(+)